MNRSRAEITINNELLEDKQSQLEKTSSDMLDLSLLIEKNKQLLIDQSNSLKTQQQELIQSEDKIEQQKQVLSEQLSIIQTQSFAIGAALLFSFSVFITIIVVFRGYHLKQRSNLMLNNKNIELEQANDRLVLMQAQLIESEKMAALGGLVAGISHEINTPIGVGVTAASFLYDSTSQLKTQIDKR